MVKGELVSRLIREQAAAWGPARAAARPMFAAGQRVLVVGSGTSYYLAEVAAEVGRRIGLHVESRAAGDVALEPDVNLAGVDRLIIISRSGSTTEATWALDEAKRRGIRTVGVTCQAESPLAQGADERLVSPVGEDDTVVMIRSFTSMLVLLQTSMGAPDADLASYADGVLRAAEEGTAAWRSSPRRAYLLGAGPRLGVVHEGALKAQEMSGRPAYGYSPLEFRHGPRGSVTSSDVVVLVGQTLSARHEYGVLEDLARQGPEIWVVAQAAWWGAAGDAPVVRRRVVLPDRVPDLVLGPLAIIPLQWIAWQMAIMNGRDPDHPENLEKVVAFRRE